MGLLKTAPGLSRVHASRRVFEQLQQQEVGGWVGGRRCWCVSGSLDLGLPVCFPQRQQTLSRFLCANTLVPLRLTCWL